MKQRPTLTAEQAADFLLKCFTKQYRASCIALFQKIHGEAYANDVKKILLEKYKGKK
jgi:hypothetical protein